jgi:GTP cyclohydrolase I
MSTEAKSMANLSPSPHIGPIAAHRLLKSALFDEPDIQAGAGGLVLVRDIDFASLSAATLLPFYGRAHIAYVPARGVVLGLSKLARLTKLCAKQLQSQEGLARQLLHVLTSVLQPAGALVVITARHLDYTAAAPPALQTSGAASGCLAEAGHGSNGSGSGATLEEALELLGAPLLPQEVELLPDAANPLCVLHPGCSCSSLPAAGRLGSSSSARGRSGNDGRSSSSHSSDGGLALLATAPACATCGSTRLAPAVLRGMSASAAGGLDSPRAPATPDPSENSDTDGSEQGSDAYCSALLLAPCSAGDVRAAPPTGSTAALSLEAAANCSAGGCSSSSLAGQGADGTVSMEAALLQLLAAADVDTSAGAVQAAARRHVLALLAATSGYHQEQPSRPVAVVRSSSSGCTSIQQQQQQQDVRQYTHHISFMSQCEHHMLPFHGTVHITYLLPRCSSSSSSNSVGSCDASACQEHQQPLSAAEAEQLVCCYTRRLQVQERITQQLAGAVQQLLQPAGVMVVVQAVHMCMVARGVENHAGSTSTRAALGAYEAQPALRCKFLRQLQQQQQQQQPEAASPVSSPHTAADAVCC